MHQAIGAFIAQPPGWAGVISARVAAAGVIFAAFVTLRKERQITDIQVRKDQEIANLRVSQDLQIEYDKDLRSRRVVQYQKLWSCMLPLAKYPEADPPAYDSIKMLSESLRDWYFGEGGLILSEETRDSYFNLQDGLKIVMQKREERWPLGTININDPEDHDRLRRHLERPEDWKAPPKLVGIANSRLDMSKKVVPKEVRRCLDTQGDLS
jgi:hypothetical protein